ncbi:N-acetylmuramoyl-L-alanine amidase [Nocardioides nanhaiensis]|uniref:MurNAc-LAA domain-containing protein n=1 Tax=Nocardioides nanhaiensis TaxID=1476871 RepID=A0ABP8VX85_9ACTN
MRAWAAGLASALLLAVLPAAPAAADDEGHSALVGGVLAGAADREPLAGRVVVLDAGHQLGNARFPRQTSRLVPAGGFRKPCNTTGTATNGGVPEATIVWQVTRLLQRRLERMGARVVLTRTSNSARRWGPCVDARGRAGNRLPSGGAADLKLSIHADGSYARGARGFHVIVPPARRPWTHDIARPSLHLARDVRGSLRRAGLRPATYVARGTGIDVRSDLATLNLSDVPTALVELGNLRDRGDARRLTSRAGQARHAAALARAVRLHLR